MKIYLPSRGMGPEIEKLLVIFWIHFSLFALAFWTLPHRGQSILADAFYFVLFLFFYRLYYKTLVMLYLTFWSFTGVAFILGLYSLYLYWDHKTLFTVIALADLFLVIQSYFLSSPIYYPVTGWWEYDFRYKGDLSVKVRGENKTEKYACRLNDLRRNAGCLVSFHSFRIGERLKLFAQVDDREEYFEITVISKREITQGRGLTYGVRFILEAREDMDRYNRFETYWRERRNAKRELRRENAV